MPDPCDPRAPAPPPPGPERLIVREAEPPNLETPVPFLTGWLTPNRLFFQRNHLTERPPYRPAAWALTADGEVVRPLRLTLADLAGLGSTSLWAVLECSGNQRAYFHPPAAGTPWTSGAVGNAQWSGVPLRALLTLCGLRPGAAEVWFAGADRGRFGATGQWVRFERSLPLRAALRPEVLLALEMNGEPLPAEHGGPLRLVVPGWYGMAWVKWLTHMRVSARPFRGPFQARDYLYLPAPGAYGQAVPVTVGRVNSLVTHPRPGAMLRPGLITVRGMAWSGAAPIAQVEVSPDGGQNWSPAALAGPCSPYAWRFWHCRVPLLRPGLYTILARATDAAGRVQPRQAPWNAKGYGNNQMVPVPVAVSVRPSTP